MRVKNKRKKKQVVDELGVPLKNPSRSQELSPFRDVINDDFLLEQAGACTGRDLPVGLIFSREEEEIRKNIDPESIDYTCYKCGRSLTGFSEYEYHQEVHYTDSVRRSKKVEDKLVKLKQVTKKDQTVWEKIKKFFRWSKEEKSNEC